MLLLAPARIADGLREGTLSERSRFQLVMLGTVVGMLFSKGPVSGLRTNGELLLGVLFLAVTVLGLRSCYAANGGADGHGFVERYVCLAIPVGFWVYGCFYLLYYSAFLGLKAGSGSTVPNFAASEWFPVALSLAATLVYFRILRGYIKRSERASPSERDDG